MSLNFERHFDSVSEDSVNCENKPQTETKNDRVGEDPDRGTASTSTGTLLDRVGENPDSNKASPKENRMSDVDSEDPENTGGVTIIIHKTRDPPLQSLDLKHMKTLSIIDIAIGLTSILLQLMQRADYTSVICGTVFFITGCIGVMMTIRTTKCFGIAFIVFNVISVICCISLLFYSLGMGVLFSHTRRSNHQAFGVLMFIISMIQGVLTIRATFLCSKSMCCSKVRDVGAYFPYHVIKSIGGIQILIGSILVILSIVNASVFRAEMMFEGVWGGLIIIGLGFYCLLGFRGNSPPNTNCMMAVHIVGSVLCVFLVFFTAVTSKSNARLDEDDLRDELGFLESDLYNCSSMVNMEGESLQQELEACEDERQEEIKDLRQKIEDINNRIVSRRFGIRAVVTSKIVLTLLEFVITVVVASVGCGACCCAPSVDSTAVYVPREELDKGATVVHVTKNAAVHSVVHQNKDDEDTDRYRRLD